MAFWGGGQSSTPGGRGSSRWDSGKGHQQRELQGAREAVHHTAGGLEDEEEEDGSDIDEEEL